MKRALAVLLIFPLVALAQEKPKVDVPYVPSSPAVVKAMLDLGAVTDQDVVYDLGSGDGRIVIGAAQRGARGVGIELDGRLIARSWENAAAAGITGLVDFRQQDLFQTDLREATVVTLYLFPAVNLKLRPKLQRELKPGSRVVSNSFDMGTWKADKMITVDRKNLYLWTIR